MYQYRATVIRILDGDSVELNIDLGLKIFFKSVSRLAGINTPELTSKFTEDRIAANAAKAYLISLLPIGTIVIIDSKSLDKYGRPLVVITTNEGLNINNEMIEKGFAVIYK